MKIEPRHLPIVNMALEQNPELSARLAEAIAALFPPNLIPAPGGTILGGGIPSPAESPFKSYTAEQLQPLILEWFKAHPGKHGLRPIRQDLGVIPESKPFKNAIRALIESKQVKYNEKRGMGAEYWTKEK